MATFTTRTVTHTRHEWRVPAAQPWGAAWTDIATAVGDAWTAYRTAHGLPEDAPMSGDFVRLHPWDDEIVISFTTEEPQR